jgi:hypothetical protein
MRSILNQFARWVAASATAALVAACGGGGSEAGAPIFDGSGGDGGSAPAPTLSISLSSDSISSATPATVTATLKDATGSAMPGQVIAFSVSRGLAQTNVPTALTDSKGRAVVVLAPASPSGAGADEVVASADVGGASVEAKRGFQVNATSVSLAFEPLPDGFALAEYGQVSLRLNIDGASVGSPVNITITSVCVSAGKATLSPASFTATTSSVELQYRDGGCGAQLASDQLQATVVGSATSSTLTIPLTAPDVSSIAFVGAEPQNIYLKGSGLIESSTVSFEVRDADGNPLPSQTVTLKLLSGAGGVTMEGLAVGQSFTARSDAQGRVLARVNSGTLPTPVRIQATVRLPSGADVSTVSSNLSVAVGLPSQLNFSLSQGTRNIEGYNIDGTKNTYQIIAADRSGNPVPTGTSINFVSEGGQVEAIKQTDMVEGIARTVANFVSSEPRPIDGRVTVTAYALGEESFIDLNGNNVFDAGEPFQDLGNIYKDRIFDGEFDPALDEYVPLAINNTAACAAIGSPLLRLDPSIPSVPATCSGNWSGAGQVYVRRATETVLSTSGARPLWAFTGSGGVGLESSCRKIDLQVGPVATAPTVEFTAAAGDTWYSGEGSGAGTLSFIVADANPGRLTSTGSHDPANGYPYPRLNPMAAGTVITASTPTQGLSVNVAGGSPVPSTTEATGASISYSFGPTAPNVGVVNITFRSPSGTATGISVTVVRNADRPSACP